MSTFNLCPRFSTMISDWLFAFSRNRVALISEVTLRRARLVLGWVTISPIYHLGI